MSPDLALLSSLIGSNYPCLELIFMIPKAFEPLKFDCISVQCTWSATFKETYDLELCYLFIIFWVYSIFKHFLNIFNERARNVFTRDWHSRLEN